MWMRTPLVRKAARFMSRQTAILVLSLLAMVAWPPAAAAAPASAPPGLLDATAADAPGPRWVRATPFGGSILSLAQAPSSPRTLYAAAATGDLFGSDDGGATWSALHGGPPDLLVTSFVVDPQVPSTVYALTSASSRSALLRTRNGGRSWKSVGFDLFIYALVVDAEQPSVLYAGTPQGLYRSGDAGKSWTPLAFAGAPLVSLAIDPFDDRSLLATVIGRAASDPTVVWRSSDRGETWQPTPLVSTHRLAGLQAPTLVFDAARPATAYAFFILQATGDTVSLFRTQDGGSSWSLVGAARGIHGLAASPGGTLYAATDFGVARSDDAGATWQPPLTNRSPAAATPPDAVAGVVVSAGSPETLFAAGSQGVWTSSDGGRQWADSSRGILAQTIFSLAAAATAPSSVLAVAGRVIYGSRDRGQSWERLHTAFQGPQPDRLLAFDPRDPQEIYGFGSDGQADHLFKSADGGHSWRQLPFPYTCGGDSICDVEMTTLALDPAHPETIFVGGFFFFHFGGSGPFLVRSDDGGATWSALATPDHLLPRAPVRLVIDPMEPPAHLYLLTCSGLYQSQNAGAAWLPTGHGLPRGRLCIGGASNLTLDPGQPRTVYVGTRGRGVYRSIDGGATFQPFGKGLEFGTITTLIVDPADVAKLYATVLDQGVWAWNAGTQAWMPLNAGLPIENFDFPLALDPQDPAALYAGTVLSGVFRLQPR
jgi:photosystem II stability/assembly factor-like uncharacterized protein